MRIQYITEKVLDDAGMQLLVKYTAKGLRSQFPQLNEEPDDMWEIHIDEVELIVAGREIDITRFLDQEQQAAIIEQLENYY
jgi:hypothetical protein